MPKTKAQLDHEINAALADLGKRAKVYWGDTKVEVDTSVYRSYHGATAGAAHGGKGAAVGAAVGGIAGFVASSGFGQELDLPKGTKLDLVMDRPLYLTQ